tara:strand:- start:31 stop:1695 length:1665 start_codon:yes stop_codon:yes gene_type:complete
MADKITIEAEVKSNIGDVSKGIDKTAKSTKDLAKQTDKLDGATKKGAKGFKSMATAAKGFGLALKAAGIGLVIALFASLKEALERNQTAMNGINTVLTTVSTTFNQVVDVLVDVFDWVTKSSDRFNGLSKVIQGLMTLALTPLKLSFYSIKLGVQQASLAWEKSWLGGGDEGKIAELRISIAETKQDILDVGEAAITAGKDIVNNVGDAVSEIVAIGEVAVDGISKINIKANYEQAQATTAAKNSAKLAEAQIQGLIEKNDLLAEKQRQIRDDETKTFAERIAANKELADVLDKQEVEMLKLADTRIAAAKFELDQNKDNIDLQVAYIQTLNDRAGVEAQIAGFRSEQLTNEVALNKELLESQNEILAEGMTGLERELEELEASYKLKLDMARKSGMATTAITKQYEAQKEQIVASGVNAQLGAYSALTGALGKLAGENKEMAIAQAVIDTYAAANAVLKDPTLVGPMRWISAAAVIATGLANVQQIMQTEVPGGGGGGSVPAANTETPAPEMLSGAFTLGGGVKPEPMQAYVVSDDITNNQDKLAAIRRRATI